ncbi:MAG: hypothetical protein K2W82_15565 [Candidatus Obscuribacterales bacterium]|nr:hypothetical protein [Candidatus Obscuribacterales bacterium]
MEIVLAVFLLLFFGLSLLADPGAVMRGVGGFMSFMAAMFAFGVCVFLSVRAGIWPVYMPGTFGLGAALAFGALSAIGAGCLGYLIWRRICGFTWRTGLLFSAVAFLSTVVSVRQEAQTAHEMKAMAPAVVAFGLAHFDKIDVNGDLSIDKGELSYYEYESIFLSLQNQIVFKHMKTYSSEIGSPLKINDNDTGVICITKADLQNYPARIAEKYKRW